MDQSSNNLTKARSATSSDVGPAANGKKPCTDYHDLSVKLVKNLYILVLEQLTISSEGDRNSGCAYFAARISSAMNAYCRALMALMDGSVAAMRFTSRHSSGPLLGLLPRTRISSCT